MSTLSEVSLLFGQRAGDLEKAREIFTAESRSFVSGILAGVQRARSDPWTTSRVRIDLPREIETESKTGYLSSQFAIARASLRFKKGTNFNAIAEIGFGVSYDQELGEFVWQVELVPAARYQRIDDLVWRHWKAGTTNSLPGAAHHDRTNTVRFAFRKVDKDLSPEAAFSDVKTVFEFVLTAEVPLGEAVGLDPAPGEEN